MYILTQFFDGLCVFRYPVVVGRFVGPGALAPFDRNLFFRYYAKLGPPVGGIPILQHVELNCSPTLLQLSHKLVGCVLVLASP